MVLQTQLVRVVSR